MPGKMADSTEKDISIFRHIKHVKFFQSCLQVLPDRHSSLDSNRLTVAFFALSGLDLLNSLHVIEQHQKDIINWIYSLQILPDKTGSNLRRCGFRGSSASVVYNNKDQPVKANPYDLSHIAMTYTGLASLAILGDDLSRVNRSAVIEGLKALQQPDGSFCPLEDDSENDMRFVYCAACICYILQDWSGMDVENSVQYIQKSLTYEGAIAQGPGLEAHGGSTFCAIAALVLMDRLHSTFTSQQLERLKRWCLFRQDLGFQGRPNKPADTCYSFWVGATLKLLDGYKFVNFENNVIFVLSTQDNVTGGLAKWPDTTPDPLHTCLGIGGLSLMDIEGTTPVHPALNISERAVAHIRYLHQQWSSSR